MIKILLMSDLHLGKEVKKEGLPSNEDRFSTFYKIISLAKEHDIFLITGDLIDSPDIENDKLQIIKNHFNLLKESNTQVIIIPVQKNSNKDKELDILNSLDILCITDDYLEKPYQYCKNNNIIHFYGLEQNLDKIFSIEKKDDSGFHIGLFYSSEPALLKEKMQDKNQNYPLDFYALGGDHSFHLYEDMDKKIIGASPGSPEAVKPDESGDRYVLSFSIKDNEIKQINRLTVNTVTLIKKEIQCDYKTDPSIIYDYINKNSSSDTILTLQLTGEKNFILDKKEIGIYKEKYQNIIIIDETIPDINKIIEEFINEDSFRGEFFKSLKEKLEKTKSLNSNSLENFAMMLNIIADTESKITEDELCKLLNA